MNRKGVLFTMGTIFLLMSSFILAKSYALHASDQDALLILQDAAAKIRYLEDDVVSMAYKQLLPISVASITRGGGTVNVLFNDVIRLQDNRDFDDRMTGYESFIEDIYAPLQNVNITMQNISANLSIDPYGSVIDLNEDDLYVYNQAALSGLVLKFKVNEQNPNLDTTSTTAGATSVRIIMLNEDDAVKSDTTTAVSRTAENTWTYKSGGTTLLTVKFGQFSGLSAGTVHVNPSVYTEVPQIELDYTENSARTIVRGGKISISMPVANLSLSHDIILTEE
jgi:hypothetical protein